MVRLVGLGWLVLIGCEPTAGTDAPETDDPAETVETADTVDTPTVDTPEDTTPPVPDLTDVLVDPTIADAVLAGCHVRLVNGRRPSTLPVASADLDGDGAVEVVLFNQVCVDASGAELIHPVLRFDGAQMQLVGALRWDEANGPVGDTQAADFVDLDADGDADLIADARTNGSIVHVWQNDGAGSFSPAPLVGEREGFQVYQSGGFTLADLDGDGALDLLAMGIDLVDVIGSARPVPIYNRLPDTMEVVPDATAPSSGAAGYSLILFSDAPTADPARYVFTLSTTPTGTEDYVWSVPDLVNLPDDFVGVQRDELTGAVINAAWFVEPSCGGEAPACVIPMGGGTVRVRRPGPWAESWADCLVLSTGRSLAPAAFFCPDPASGRYLEAGDLSQQISIPSERVGGPGATSLAWIVTDRWDYNADGEPDVLFTHGRDAGPFPPMNQFVFLGDPACRDGTCARYALGDPAWGTGHYHGIGWFPYQDADGSWRLIGWLSSDAESEEDGARVGLFSWRTTGDRRWVALELGAPGRLEAIGARVRGSYVDGSGATVGEPWERTAALLATWGQSGGDPPMIVGVPPAAASLRLDIDLPGCHPSVTLEVTAFNRPVRVDVPACP